MDSTPPILPYASHVPDAQPLDSRIIERSEDEGTTFIIPPEDPRRRWLITSLALVIMALLLAAGVDSASHIHRSSDVLASIAFIALAAAVPVGLAIQRRMLRQPTVLVVRNGALFIDRPGLLRRRRAQWPAQVVREKYPLRIHRRTVDLRMRPVADLVIVYRFGLVRGTVLHGPLAELRWLHGRIVELCRGSRGAVE